ncbi:MAG: pteridine reductase [Proteobacteria bacterium]|nr:pteridine reductase [Pseudomonadota bacterium]
MPSSAKMSESRVVLVTGAARRIGACIAETFHRRGYRVIIHFRHAADDANALVKRLNAQRAESACGIQADLNSREQSELLASKALDCFGRLDTLVNNASSYYPTRFGESTQQQWDDLQNSNVRSAYFLAQSFSDELARQAGSIVNVIDTHADRPLRHYPIYSIAKAGLKAMTRSLAIELAPKVRVNGVSPGAILWPAALADTDNPAVVDARKNILQQIPLRALGKPADIADAVYFLAAEGTYVNGQVIKVDGGRSLA